MLVIEGMSLNIFILATIEITDHQPRFRFDELVGLA